MEEVLTALGALRIPLVRDEFVLQALVAQALDASEIAYQKEARLCARCRVDFLTEGGIAIEVKRGKPQKAALLAQVRRYAAQEDVRAVVLVVERCAALPESVAGKPCVVFPLNRLWGVAI